MVWQDMTTPAIKSTRGDMKGFPFRLLLNRYSDSNPDDKINVMAIKIWN
jgi:alpha-glucosidase